MNTAQLFNTEHRSGALVVLVVAVLAGLVQRDFGAIQVSNVRYDNHNGITVRAKLLRPVGATDENPLPGAVYIHGCQNTRETSDAYCIEMARRGFVMLCIDAIGRGNSGVNLLGGTGEALAAGGMGVRGAVMAMHNALAAIAEMQKPWLAAVNGPAVGGGCNLALNCDLVLAAGSAFVSLGYVNVGMVQDLGGSFLVPRLVGLRKANELAFFGERVYGPEAAEIGLINRTVPDDELMESTREWAARLTAGPTLAIGVMKLAMRRALHGTFRDALQSEATVLALIAQTEDAAEDLMAFFQKREPEFKGR